MKHDSSCPFLRSYYGDIYGMKHDSNCPFLRSYYGDVYGMKHYFSTIDSSQSGTERSLPEQLTVPLIGLSHFFWHPRLLACAASSLLLETLGCVFRFILFFGAQGSFLVPCPLFLLETLGCVFRFILLFGTQGSLLVPRPSFVGSAWVWPLGSSCFVGTQGSLLVPRLRRSSFTQQSMRVHMSMQLSVSKPPKSLSQQKDG